MVSKELERGILGRAGLDLVPEAIRDNMYQDSAFLEAFGLALNVEGIVGFSGGARIKTASLFKAIAEADKTGNVITVYDEEMQEWSLAINADDQDIRCPQLTRGTDVAVYPEGVLLLSDPVGRQRQFERMANEAGLPGCHRTPWMEILLDRPLTSAEIGQMHRDLDDTPHSMMRRLSDALQAGETSVEIFVPESRRYYERLVGELGDANDVREHATGGAQELVTELFEWSLRDGFEQSLFLASHSAYSAIVPVTQLPDSVVREIYDKFVSHGDMISRLAAIEVGLPLLSDRPQLSEPIFQLVNIVRTEDPEAGNDAFSDLARFFIFVESEVSRLGVLKGFPAFYRRAASFAQASLIQKQLNVLGADSDGFRKWIDQHFGLQFYAQSLVDMRLAPRWHPELIQSVQLKQEFIGRILSAADVNKDNLSEGRLTDVLSPSSEHEESLISAASFPRPFFYGPLEGNVPALRSLSSEAQGVIDEQLSQPELSTRSFIAAINLASMYEIDVGLATRIAERLRGGNYHFHDVRGKNDLAATLCGLAVLAAVTRSHELARDVRVLVRKYRRDPTHNLSVSAASRAVFSAAAAFEDLEEWCNFVGDAIEELSFSTMSRDEADNLLGLLSKICEAEPNLWTRIGAAEAALGAFLSS